MRHYRKRYADQSKQAAICEASGLQRLATALVDAGETSLKVPRVLAVSRGSLETERIEQCPGNAARMAMLGEGLARLHAQTQATYGLDEDNFIGLAPQRNAVTDNWGRFFLEYRLRPQVQWIKEHRFRAHASSILDQHGQALTDWLNRHVDHPSLVHGDLWAGNVLFDQQRPWLIDPAIYCGDRETDLAMTELFGGFSSAFYAAYDAVYPRSGAYTHKRVIYNLYHFLNHYNLFGSAYRTGCEKGLAALARLSA